MIKTAFDLIKNELEKSTNGNGFKVFIDHLHKLKGQNIPEGIYLSLTSFKRETAFGHLSPFKKTPTSIEIKEPPVYLNAYIMVASFYKQYDSSLIHLNTALEFFQNRPYLDKYNIHITSVWPPEIERIAFDWHNLEIDKLNQLWGVHGGIYLPSFLYQVRMLRVLHQEQPKPGPPITEVKYDTSIP